MKSLKFLLAIVLMFSGLNLWSQIAINADGSDPDPAAMLDVQSTNSGILIPRMLAAQRDAIPNPATGLMVYVTDVNLFYYYDGSKSGWMPLGSGGSGGDGWQITGTDMYSTVSGKVGIGTTSPGYKLTVDGGHGLIKGLAGWNTNGDQARLYLGDGNHSLFAVHSQGLRIRTHNTAGHSIRWGGSNGVDYMTLKMESGYLGIGTTDPGAKLDVRGWNVDDGVLIQTGNSDMSHKLVLFGGKQSDPNPFILWKDGDPLRFCTDQGGWSEKMRIASNGWIGIGTEDPKAPLHITSAPGNLRGQLSITDPAGDDAAITFYAGTTYKSYIGYTNGNAEWSTDDGSNIILSGSQNSGNVGVGWDVNSDQGKQIVKSKDGKDEKAVSHKLTIASLSDDNTLRLIGPDGTWKYGARLNFGDSDYAYIEEDVDDKLAIYASRVAFTGGNVGIGTDNPIEKLTVRGNILVESTTGEAIVELGEGLDFAEGFNVSNSPEAVPGTVLVLDPNCPGELMISEQAYDTKVAGIVAGANSLGSGVKLGSGKFDCDVALAGRVYCNVDASYGAVSIGDLLTTSPTPGHAMVVKNPDKAHGTILGKAMQSLEKGKRGEILVLVTLQ